MAKAFRFWDGTGYKSIPYVKGEKGDSAYAQAVAAGYTGTLEEFTAQLNNIGVHMADETKHVTAESKETPADADSIALVDSADGGKIKKLLWSKIKTLFAAKSHTHAEADFTGTLSAGKGGTGVTSLSDLLSSLNVLGAGTVITGSYSGNGQAYEGNTGYLETSIPFSSRPKLVVITNWGSNAISAFGILMHVDSGIYCGTSLTRMANTVTPDECPISGSCYDGSLKFYTQNPTGFGTSAQQLNLDNVQYAYVAIF